MTDTAPDETEPFSGAQCPECEQRWPTARFGAHWRYAYSHLRDEHGWTEEQVTEHKISRGVVKADATIPKPDAKTAKATVNRARRVTGPASAPPKVGTKDLAKKMATAQANALWILTQGNPALCNLAPLLLGVPPEALSLQLQLTNGTVVIPAQVVCFNPAEAFIVGSAAAFGDSDYLEKIMGKVLPPALTAMAAFVVVSHMYNLGKLRPLLQEAVARMPVPTPAPAPPAPEPEAVPEPVLV
jgi:hypothetical protein